MVKVSVIMSTYNGEKVISNSILSILNQTFQDWEFIICDDGSIDESRKIISDFCSKDKRIKLISHNYNKGLSQSLNECIMASKGIYLARMDDDDFSKSDRLKTQVAYLESKPKVAWVGTNADMYNGNKIYGTRLMLSEPNKKDIWLGHTFIHPSVMIRSSVIKKVNGYNVSDQVTRIEDYDLWCKLYSQGYHGANLQQELLVYREDDISFKKRDIKRRLRLFKCMQRWRKELGLNWICIFYSYLFLAKILIPNKLIGIYHRLLYIDK